MRGKADLVVKSNAIFTGLENEAFKGGIAIIGNKIVAVENESALDEWIDPHTKIYTYEDEMVMPGFIDAHMHFFTGAFVSSKYMLTSLSDARSEEDCLKLVQNFASEHPEYERITGMGWLPTFWDDHKALPHRSSLDEVVSDRPVYLLSADCHTFWLNSKALEECDFNKDTKVSFGEIGKDSNGELNGLLFEIEACAPANQRAFITPKEEAKEIQVDFYKEIAKFGITSATDLSAAPTPVGQFLEYQTASELEKDGKLTVRLHLFPSLGLDTNLEKVKSLSAEYSSDKLRVSGLKQFVDGVTSTYTAYLLKPYSDKGDTVGFINYPKELLQECVINANKEGYAVRLHAIGDGAVRVALDLFEESNRVNDNTKIKNCIEHIESIHPMDIDRFSELGVIASMQPVHLILDVNEKVSRIGEERSVFEWPCKTLLNRGAVLAFGTDFPVASIDPFLNIYAAVTRSTAKGELVGVNAREKLSVVESLRAYTYGGACVLNREHELGTLETGKLADVIVLNKNILSGPDVDILNTSIKLTIMDGEVVFEE